MNIEEVHRIVSKIKASLFKNSSSYAMGMLKSHFKGTGIRFKEHQIYVHGDDVRFLDWKILAKTSEPYIKTFEEERNLEIVVIIDASPTMLTGWKNVSKLQAGMEISCLLYLLAKGTGDKIHALVITDEIFDIPPGEGEEGITNFISTLHSHGIVNKAGNVNISYRYRSEVEIEGKLAAIMKHLRRKREIVILSDFNEFVKIDLLKKILYQSNVHSFRLESPLDRGDSTPYSVFIKKSLNSNKGLFREIKTNMNDTRMDFLGKRVKTLKVDERYLEDFIKQML